MSKSYRIKATPGDDKNIIVEVNQDFEQLEILSLKIRQEDVYDRMCADYGVVAGRVIANRGYGIPNAKVSIFIPVKNEDKDNPLINFLYPYSTLYDRNEDGYKFNILPSIPSYEGHVPTGTFPNRLDTLRDESISYVYDTYYKYTVTTNDSGDFLIYGVPLGNQTIVMNVDLSDIGEFSLRPADLIRMGVGIEGQFDGVKFKSSPNFEELPQIIVINKTIDVVPFWGQPESCQIGITRTDFDLTGEANIDIQPTAIFMGSIMSTSERGALKANGSAKSQTGELCKLIVGPGEIQAITQTIFQDSNGLPVLARGELPNGGKLIDENGTWLFDVPMNYDYVFTNEFGEKVLSDDPAVGIPTKGKYRFKIMWQQSRNLNEDYKVGYYIVPNIKEKGWESGIDPALYLPDENNPDWVAFQRSYAFSLNWSAYTASRLTFPVQDLTMSNPDIADAVNCEDTFYEFDYNKVYTVAGFLDNYKLESTTSSLLNAVIKVSGRERFIGIKRIDDDTCDDSVNKYPVNDGVFRTPLIWIITNFILTILFVIGLPVIIVYSIIAFLWNWLKVPLFLFLEGMLIKEAVNWTIVASTPVPGVGPTGPTLSYNIAAIAFAAVYWALVILLAVLFAKLKDFEFKPLRFKMITYPDCELCSCEEGALAGGTSSTPAATPRSQALITAIGTISAYGDCLSDEECYANNRAGDRCYCSDSCNGFNGQMDVQCITRQFAGNNTGTRRRLPDETYQVPVGCVIPGNPEAYMYTPSLPLAERINQFSLKASYYNDTGGWNQIRLKIDPSANTASNLFHLDNFLVLMFAPGTYSDFSAGTMLSFIDVKTSLDPNIKSGITNTAGTKSISGVTRAINSVNIQYARPDRRYGNNSVNYTMNPSAIKEELYYTYHSDVEYFQVITGITVSRYRELVATRGNSNNGLARALLETTIINKINFWASSGRCACRGLRSFYDDMFVNNFGTWDPIRFIDQESVIMIIQRGVDPYSPLYPTEVGLGKIIGRSNHLDERVTIPLRLNIPIQNKPSAGNHEMMVRHHEISNNFTQNQGGQFLFYPSYIFEPDSAVYTAYTTTLHRYYSEIDAQWVVDNGLTLSTPRYASAFLFAGARDASSHNSNTFYNNSSTFLTNTGRNYGMVGGFLGSVVGGSFIYKRLCDNCTGVYPCPSSLATVPRCNYRNGRPCCIRPEDLNGCLRDNNQYNFSRIYNSNITPLTMSDRTRIVMRSDRLPSSDSLSLFDTGSTATGAIRFNRTPLWAANPSLNITSYADGQAITYKGGSQYFALNAGEVVSGANSFVGTVMDTFDCSNMVDLDCYESVGLNFKVKKGCAKSDKIEGGCYVFVTEPLLGLGKDISNWGEFSFRFRFFYAICQGVFSNVFTNNWVNGNLFAPSFKVDTYFNSLNQVSKRVFPSEIVILHEDTNSFYYRSTPVSPRGVSGYNFRGSEVNSPENGQNSYQIKTPTTILNLGPIDPILKNISLNSNFYGYNIDKLPETTYSDLSEMINFFSIIRIVNTGFLKKMIGNDVLKDLFSRPGNRVDADFAQTAAINTQLGVVPFDSDYYSTSGDNAEIIAANPGGGARTMMGVFFNSSNDDIQIRDLISPVRLIRYNPFSSTPFVYDNLNVKSQIVPHYAWNVRSGNDTIFGTQTNNWNTTTSIIRSNAYRYQELDRRAANQYHYIGDLTNDYNYRGYIFGYSTGPIVLNAPPSGGLIMGGTYTIIDYQGADDFAGNTRIAGSPNSNGFVFTPTSSSNYTWLSGTVLLYNGKYQVAGDLQNNPGIVGAPWYFYFGARKGATALNRFKTKYLGQQFP